MRTLLVILLVAWLGITILGLVLDAVKWLAIIGIVLFVVTVLYWVFKSRSARKRKSAA